MGIDDQPYQAGDETGGSVAPEVLWRDAIRLREECLQKVGHTLPLFTIALLQSLGGGSLVVASDLVLRYMY